MGMWGASRARAAKVFTLSAALGVVGAACSPDVSEAGANGASITAPAPQVLFDTDFSDDDGAPSPSGDASRSEALADDDGGGAGADEPGDGPPATTTPAAVPAPPLIGDCDPVNGFTITIVAGQPTCTHISRVAKPYTDAVLANSLGRELHWTGQGFVCVRNYDSTGVTANANGLICEGNPGAFVLFYHQ